MASIHKRPDSPFWRAHFYRPDGTRASRTTGTTDRKKAMQIAIEYEKTSGVGRAGMLTDQKARAVIADIFKIANSDLMPTATVEEYLDRWLKVKELETKDSTMAEYRKTAERLKNTLGAKVRRPMDAVTVADALKFRDGLIAVLSNVTANKHLKIARVIWNDAARDSLASDNPFAKVKTLETQASHRKAFTVEQVKSLLDRASPSWRGMILLGFYAGQRLGDLARLTWQNVDLEREQINLTTQKTGRSMKIPMSQPLIDYFAHVESSDDPSAPIFPDLADLEIQTLSNQFAQLVADCGLRKFNKKRKRDEDSPRRGDQRKTGQLSFHSLRHTATSALKNAGVSEAVAMELIGHDSAAHGTLVIQRQ